MGPNWTRFLPRFCVGVKRLSQTSFVFLWNRPDGQRRLIRISFIHTGCGPSARARGQSYSEENANAPVRSGNQNTHILTTGTETLIFKQWEETREPKGTTWA